MITLLFLAYKQPDKTTGFKSDRIFIPDLFCDFLMGKAPPIGGALV
jgi:hypothetical protein